MSTLRCVDASQGYSSDETDTDNRPFALMPPHVPLRNSSSSGSSNGIGGFSYMPDNNDIEVIEQQAIVTCCIGSFLWCTQPILWRWIRVDPCMSCDCRTFVEPCLCRSRCAYQHVKAGFLTRGTVHPSRQEILFWEQVSNLAPGVTSERLLWPGKWTLEASASRNFSKY